MPNKRWWNIKPENIYGSGASLCPECGEYAYLFEECQNCGYSAEEEEMSYWLSDMDDADPFDVDEGEWLDDGDWFDGEE